MHVLPDLGVRKLLAIKLRALGDTVLMTAPLIELRKNFPNAEIHALVHEDWAPLLEGHAAVDRVWTFPATPSRAKRLRAVSAIAFSLRRAKFDTVVCFHASPSSAALAFATGAKTRSVHFHGHRDKNRFSTVVIPGKGVLKPIIERDMDAVRALGVIVPEGRLPQIAVRKPAKSSLQGPILGLGLGASRPTKAWPIERFAKLAVDWCLTENGSVISFAGPNEAELTAAFFEYVEDLLRSRVTDPSRQAEVRSQIDSKTGLPLRELMEQISGTAIFAGNDSGPRHLAVAVGVPTVTLFGPEDPFEWHPYPIDQHPRLFVEELACRRDADPGMPAWCALDVCVQERHRCMQLIAVDSVLGLCRKVARKVA